MTDKPKKQTYRVYIAQVNQTYVEVEARNAEDAKEKGYAEWKKREAHSRVVSVERLDQ